MAGNPRRRAMIDELYRLAREEFGDEVDPTFGPLDYAELRIESGTTLVELAYELSQALEPKLGKGAVQPAVLTRYLNSLEEQSGARRNERLKSARLAGARSIAEGTRLIARRASTKEEIKRAKVEIESDHWLAERWNRDEFGQQRQQGVSVAISFSGMHLDALRARAVLAELPAPSQHDATDSGELIEAQVVELQGDSER